MASIAGIVIPTVVPSSVFGKNSPSNIINMGMIGTGRQAIKVNLLDGFLKLENCQVIAVNDVDEWGIKKEYELPVKVSGTGTFSKGLWNTI